MIIPSFCVSPMTGRAAAPAVVFSTVRICHGNTLKNFSVKEVFAGITGGAIPKKNATLNGP